MDDWRSPDNRDKVCTALWNAYKEHKNLAYDDFPTIIKDFEKKQFDNATSEEAYREGIEKMLKSMSWHSQQSSNQVQTPVYKQDGNAMQGIRQSSMQSSPFGQQASPYSQQASPYQQQPFPYVQQPLPYAQPPRNQVSRPQKMMPSPAAPVVLNTVSQSVVVGNPTGRPVPSPGASVQKNQASPSPQSIPTVTATATESAQSKESAYNAKLDQLQVHLPDLKWFITSLEERSEPGVENNNVKVLRDMVRVLTREKRVPVAQLRKMEVHLEKISSQAQRQSEQLLATESVEVKDLESVVSEFLETLSSLPVTPQIETILARLFSRPLDLLGPSTRVVKRQSSASGKLTTKSPALWREIRNLSCHFKVEVIQRHATARPEYECNLEETIYLLCRLDYPGLPSVPPLTIGVPGDYPRGCSPKLILDEGAYRGSNFSQGIYLQLFSPRPVMDFVSITQILSDWEKSVHDAIRVLS